ncbi:MFS transporter [Amnibacterium flavum]|uniref:MFS transporter n=1 Tax=Amnibacterium flavum TaxID=2173173 RepID=A0A2V1HQ47_9MICO|nr:MFS transporter [Amnibacterium flavum]PVZ94736.1 MFS transporter [Amnibacterium flavum]
MTSRETAETGTGASGPRSRRIHPAWIVALVAFLALVGAAGFRAAPSALMLPLEGEFGWSRTEISVSVTVNLLLYGLTAPFAAALMNRFGLRAITSGALALVSAGAALSIFATAPWMLVLTWGVLIGLGTGSMALVFAATVADTWFIKSRGLVVGILTAGGATGQLVFLPLIAGLVESYGWRPATLLVAACALAVVPLVLVFLRNRPEDLQVTPFGAPENWRPAPRSSGNAARLALSTLGRAAKVRTFWALVAGFAICGATTNGLVGTHFIPSAHDHGMGETTAAGLLAVVGIFDVVGTIASGWLTDRVNPRILLAVYYAGRGVGLLVLPFLLSATVQPPIIVFVVIYGLDWVATVPPTVALCRELFGADGPIVFGWVFASHQIGAAVAATVAGFIRDSTGEYTIAWFGAAALCVVAAVVSVSITRRPLAPIS